MEAHALVKDVEMTVSGHKLTLLAVHTLKVLDQQILARQIEELPDSLVNVTRVAELVLVWPSH